MKLMEESMADKAERVWSILGLSGSDDFAALMKDLMATPSALKMMKLKNS